ncbi:MAG: KH domain-containing protein [Candidatus Buchananbacteria bacterium]|nr:KH domain-containing protein [Candidatus Buchananbacteria bacterium]
MAERDQQFVEGIVKAIVSKPDDVRVDRIVDERGVLLTLNVNPADIGYVIGKQGQTARAIRTLAKIIGAQNNARVNLKIAEPEGSRGPRPRPEQAAEQIDTDVIDDLTI